MKHAVIGTLEVKPGTRDEVLRAVLAHRERSLRDEPGTLQFEVLIPNKDENKILLFELYTDTAAFEAHFHHGASMAQAKKEIGHLMVSLTGVHSTLAVEHHRLSPARRVDAKPGADDVPAGSSSR
ncbi:MAG TPA: putative quinol monooxygenase [Caldimonas sp.]|jgi:quinol monooxygenase YgiN|nr:putative quinol monooxygenase [Caldimonas sp.]HEX2541160.1 putative quinol monooxygenase [Caldimonas sp.]